MSCDGLVIKTDAPTKRDRVVIRQERAIRFVFLMPVFLEKSYFLTFLYGTSRTKFSSLQDQRQYFMARVLKNSYSKS